MVQVYEEDRSVLLENQRTGECIWLRALSQVPAEVARWLEQPEERGSDHAFRNP